MFQKKSDRIRIVIEINNEKINRAYIKTKSKTQKVVKLNYCKKK